MYNLVRSTPALQYPIELIACGMLDNGQSATSLGERLVNLRRHDQAWRTLRWSHDIQFGIPFDGRIESKQGLVLVTKERLHPERGVDVMQLPSSARNVAFRQWTIEPGQEGDPFGHGQIYDVCSHVFNNRISQALLSRLVGRCLAGFARRSAWHGTVQPSSPETPCTLLILVSF